MNEVAKIKELADKEKLHVVPIFYKLKVGDVRGQTGKFGTKFWNLARASTGDQIKTWKEALECISDKMGLSLKDQRYFSTHNSVLFFFEHQFTPIFLIKTTGKLLC